MEAVKPPNHWSGNKMAVGGKDRKGDDGEEGGTGRDG